MPPFDSPFLDLILNLSLLIALTVVSGFLFHKWPSDSPKGSVLQGLLFGTVAVLGMLRPLDLGGGIIFDGRSVMISLCSLFYGPIAGVVSAIPPLVLRVSMGGSGMIMGVLVILSSLAIGILAGKKMNTALVPPTAWQLYGFGMVVHLAMLVMMLALPAEIRGKIFTHVGPPIILLYPAATVLAGKVLSDLLASQKTLRSLQEAQEHLAVTLQSIGDGVIVSDGLGKITWINPAAEILTGWSREEALGRPVREVLNLINEETREKVEDPTGQVIREGKKTGLANHALLITKSGREIPVADSGAPVRNDKGQVLGAVIVFRDQRDERLTQRLLEARLHLMTLAQDHPFPDFLRMALDEIGGVVSSPLGFFHFVNEDQRTLAIQQWSTRCLEECCLPFRKGESLHYPVDKAGVWIDGLLAGKAVMHNDYATLSHRKGYPEGHPEIIRELVVPVYRQGKAVAVLGVGNKPERYTQKDLEVVSLLAEVAWDMVEAMLAKAALKESEEKFRTTFYTSPDAVLLTRLEDGYIVEVNEGFTRIFGFTPEEARGKTTVEIDIWADPADRKRMVEEVEKRGICENLEARFRRKDGTFGIGLLSSRMIKLGNVPHLISISRDITAIREAEKERKKLEEQLFQAQKMESVGKLAGGVAHDFNNMLGVILGRTELALSMVEADSSLYENLLEIQKAAQRSATLTRQLLGFARRQTFSPKRLDLNETIERMLSMLKRLIGEDIDLAFVAGVDLWPVLMDPHQLDQILANLVVNARDAIAAQGKITLETQNVILDEGYCQKRPFAVPGRYVCLSVSDDGCGIAPEIIDKIYDPFFTTKEVGQGTGLGLATVYGIVKQNNGYINVYSELGKGTTFKVYFPAHDVGPVETVSEEAQPMIQGGKETVLFVEDEPLLLELGATMLRNLGYRVLLAPGPLEAVETARIYEGEIPLLITDVIMPEMNGMELFEKISAFRPGIKCLFASGYTENVVARHGILKEGICFIQKPFTLRELAEKIREALG